ncbi:MAG: hypothetical protein HY828_21330 [Actinobacteria bacterium]|nr:hypothetical protein [Actinomycetota bacterium]
MTDSWPPPGSSADALAAQVWVPIGVPGYAGIDKARRATVLSERFGDDGWHYSHVVRGQVVGFAEAIAEYEESYRRFLRDRPALVALLTIEAGNVYDDNPTNVFDDEYDQPNTAMNHYQDISVRRVIAELADDPEWPAVVAAGAGEVVDLVDLRTGLTHRSPRAKGFQGPGLLQIRDAGSPGYVLNPALVPVHDPALITTLPTRQDWYHVEGCAHLSVEAFWQMSKVIEVRYDRFLALPADLRDDPLSGL